MDYHIVLLDKSCKWNSKTEWENVYRGCIWLIKFPKLVNIGLNIGKTHEVTQDIQA